SSWAERARSMAFPYGFCLSDPVRGRKSSACAPCVPFVTCDRVHAQVTAGRVGPRADVTFAETFGHANRAFVGRVDETDDLGPTQRGEAPVQREARGFACVTFAPTLARNRPPELEAGPVVRFIDETDTSEEFVR